MSNPLLRIQRAQLVDIIGDDPAAIRAFEELFKQTDVEGGPVGEAPEDSTPYSREDADWVSAPLKADVGLNTIHSTGDGSDHSLLETLTNDSMVDTLHRHSELSASDGSPDAVVNVDSDGILYVDAAPKGLDVLYSAEIGTHLTVGNNLIIGGTVDGIDIATDVGANNAKVTNATHSGEVTGATGLAIADNIVDEANLKLDSGPTNDHVLTADSGESGGMKWAAPSGDIVASGSNPNGDYVRFSNGMQICWARASETVASWGSTANTYGATAGNLYWNNTDFDWPIAFSAKPIAVGSGLNATSWLVDSVTTTTQYTIQWLSGANGSQLMEMSVIAIGPWE